MCPTASMAPISELVVSLSDMLSAAREPPFHSVRHLCENSGATPTVRAKVRIANDSLHCQRSTTPFLLLPWAPVPPAQILVLLGGYHSDNDGNEKKVSTSPEWFHSYIPGSVSHVFLVVHIYDRGCVSVAIMEQNTRTGSSPWSAQASSAVLQARFGCLPVIVCVSSDFTCPTRYAAGPARMSGVAQ